MAYRDPYTEQYARSNQHYTDGPEYNPYGATQQPHQTYDQAGYEPDATGAYRDEPHPQSPEDTTSPSTTAHDKEAGEFVNGRTEKSVRDLRNYRYEGQRALWTKGGRGRCVGRFCCCTILIVLFFVISIVLTLLLWVRPPNIGIGDVKAPSSGSEIQLTTDGLDINLGVDISVENPNYFGVSFKKIQADIFYPINNTAIGGGSQKDITFHSHSQTNFTFPFTISYKKSLDPNNQILTDIATKCGFIGGNRSQIKVDYKITLGLRIIFITISPVVSNSLSFDCPLSEDEIASLGAGLLGGT